MVRFPIIGQNVNMATNAILYCGLSPVERRTKGSLCTQSYVVSRWEWLAMVTQKQIAYGGASSEQHMSLARKRRRFQPTDGFIS